MIPDSDRSTPTLWARFRFSVVGALLSSPLAHGELKAALQSLAAKTWTHPVSGREVRFSAATSARWYYTARREKDDPVRVLRRAVRKDGGRVSLPPALAEHLFRQYRDYEHWTYQLHYDNLAARVKADPSLGPLRSYSTIRRYMQAHGLVRKRRLARKGRPGEEQAIRRRERREVRSYEAEYAGSLWHLDFHHGSLKVLTPRGQWQPRPADRQRLGHATHAQTAHLEVVAEPHDGKPASLPEHLLTLLADGAVLTRARLRDLLGVKNERLGQTLQSLERAGQLRRTPSGWQRAD